MKLSSKATLYLSLATLMWGLSFPLTRNALQEIDPVVFVSWRFIIATLFLIPLVYKSLPKTTKSLIFSSLIIGMLNAVAYLCQTIGLETVYSAQAAFITGTSVILVPFLAPLFGLHKASTIDILCACVAFLGLYVLTGLTHFQLSPGDLWIFAGALSLSLQITYLQYITQRIAHHELLAIYQLFFTVPFVMCLAKGHSFSLILQPKTLIALLFCGVFATAAAYYIQNKYQRFISASKAALIFSLEPIHASLFSFLLNGELLARSTIYGGLLLLLSLMLPTLINRLRAYFYNTQH